MTDSESMGDDISPGGRDERLNQSRWRLSMRKRLLAWFDENQRTLPWRSDPTPYKVWISEIMLQQTQVATVLGYFDRFIEALPNIEALANAPEQELLSLWEGLGYYRRARLMQRAANEMVLKHRGQFPTQYEQVLSLPGIGRYTAGAILSIADDQRLPIVEGNTVRVYSRWVALTEPIKSAAAVSTLWEVATAMLPRRGSGTFNQAAMELGALICKPKPDCDRCPVRRGCAANELSLQHSIPGKVSTTVYEDRREFAFVITRQTSDRQRSESSNSVDQDDSDGVEYLLHHRGPTMRWAGMWDFPRATESNHVDIQTAVDELADAIGIQIRPGLRLKTIKHGVTKFRIELQVYRGSIDWPAAAKNRGKVTNADAGKRIDQDDVAMGAKNLRWVSDSQLKTLAMPVTGRKIADWLRDNAQGELF